MTTATSLSAAIVDSISLGGIARLSLPSALRSLATEARQHGDLATVQAVTSVLDPCGADADDVDIRETLRDLIGQIIAAATSDHDDVDSVENDDIVEVWGTDEDGDTYRVHIEMRGLMG